MISPLVFLWSFSLLWVLLLYEGMDELVIWMAYYLWFGWKMALFVDKCDVLFNFVLLLWFYKDTTMLRFHLGNVNCITRNYPFVTIMNRYFFLSVGKLTSWKLQVWNMWLLLPVFVWGGREGNFRLHSRECQWRLQKDLKRRVDQTKTSWVKVVEKDLRKHLERKKGLPLDGLLNCSVVFRALWIWLIYVENSI